MKKIFTIFIAILYLSVSTGMTVEIHLCMGKIADISLIPADEHTCGECGMAKGANECCKDELKFVKLNDSHKLIKSAYQLAVPEAIILHEYYLADHRLASRFSFNQSNNHSPPDLVQPSLFILNCVFRI